MATKSKRYSRSGFWKFLAFFLVCLSVCSIVYQGLQTYYQVSRASVPLTADILFVSDYTQSEAFLYADYYQVTSTLGDMLAARSVSADQKELLNHRIVYYINDGSGFEYYNSNYQEPDQFTGYTPYSYLFENGNYLNHYGDNGSVYHYAPNSAGTWPTVYFSFYPQYIAERQAAWTEVQLQVNPAVYSIAGCAALSLLLTVYLTFVTGRRREDDEVHLSTFDRLYSDLILVTQLGFVTAWIALVTLVVQNNRYTSGQSTDTTVWLAVIISALIAPCVLGLYLSLIRKIKGRKLLRHSLIGAIVNGIFRLIRGFFRSIFHLLDMLFIGRRFQDYPFARAMFRRQAGYLLSSVIIVFFFGVFALAGELVGMLSLAMVELIVTVHYIRANNNTFEDMERICAQVYQVYQGNMDFNPQLREGTQLYATSRQLLDVGEGMTRSMERQLASERTKIALVTNVSHDLKTPLTSIIGYIDLLAQDETLSAEARDYVTILNNKSQRLKSIIQDLFDLAKTTGGDDNLYPEVLELRRLIEQTLAEMEDKITQSGQVVKAALPEEAVHTCADGRKLYRVIQNVLDNALKYSMPGTRIFITLSHSETHGRIDFKNTASYEMNFTAEEILERFARGDEARTSEGSGLGLNIAESFTRACGGEMKVRIDGDQFKLSLLFPLSPPPGELPEPEPQPEPELLQPKSADVPGKKIYQPRADTPPQLLNPTVNGHFEPEKPVEIAELESVLEAFDNEQFPDVQVENEHRGEKKAQLRRAGRAAKERLGQLGAETGEAIEQLRSMLDIPGSGKQKDHVKESKWKRPKAFDQPSVRQRADIVEPDFEALPPDDLPEFIRHFQELKAETEQKKQTEHKN